MRLKLLIVEDNLDWQGIYRQCLPDTDYEIQLVRRADEALQLLQTQSFDVVIADLRLIGDRGQFSGFRILDAARRLDETTQVIVATSYGESSNEERALDSGAYDFVIKDRHLPRRLPELIHSAKETQRLRQELETPMGASILDQPDNVETEFLSDESSMMYLETEAYEMVQASLTSLGGDRLISICFDHFRPVYQQFRSEMRTQQRIALLLQHCHDSEQLEQLQTLLSA